jgi:hypothetical protein
VANDECNNCLHDAVLFSFSAVIKTREMGEKLYTNDNSSDEDEWSGIRSIFVLKIKFSVYKFDGALQRFRFQDFSHSSRVNKQQEMLTICVMRLHLNKKNVCNRGKSQRIACAH